jgi:predicted naringenin-chalcone synthase
MYVAGLGLAVPERSYTQPECWQALQGAASRLALRDGSWTLLRKVLLGDSWIARRHFSYADLAEAFVLTPDALHHRFLDHAPRLATAAAQRALAAARLTPHEVDAVVVSTCTGYLCPGLTSYLVETLGLRPEVTAFDLVGHGCAAAIPNWQAADALLAGGRARRVLSVCVELSTAAIYLDDDPGVLISACLFGDGASALVFADEPPPHGRRLRWRHIQNATLPGQRGLLRFEHRDGMLRNVLSIAVPAVAAQAAREVLEAALARAGLQRGQITGWLLHPGGKAVLVALREALQLTDADLAWSRSVLREYGNLSSASLGFVLQAALDGQAPGGHWWLSSFGAGFACHGALVEVD